MMDNYKSFFELTRTTITKSYKQELLREDSRRFQGPVYTIQEIQNDIENLQQIEKENHEFLKNWNKGKPPKLEKDSK